MLSFSSYLQEARRNSHLPEQQKKSAFELVSKFKDGNGLLIKQPNYYISFVSIEKLGINPSSKYNTPNGIYCYPLMEAYKLYFKKSKTLSSVPFVGDAPYFYLFKTKEPLMEVSDYTDARLSKDIQILKKTYQHAINEIHPDVINNRFKTDTKGFKDNWQCVVRSSYRTISKQYKMDPDELDEDGDHPDKADYESFGLMWNLTRNLAALLSPRNSAQKWANILRLDLGYKGFEDTMNKGWIHPSEEMQAVVFSKEYVEVYKGGDNIEVTNDISITSGLSAPIHKLLDLINPNNIKAFISFLINDELKLNMNGKTIKLSSIQLKSSIRQELQYYKKWISNLVNMKVDPDVFAFIYYYISISFADGELENDQNLKLKYKKFIYDNTHIPEVKSFLENVSNENKQKEFKEFLNKHQSIFKTSFFPNNLLTFIKFPNNKPNKSPELKIEKYKRLFSGNFSAFDRITDFIQANKKIPTDYVLKYAKSKFPLDKDPILQDLIADIKKHNKTADNSVKSIYQIS